MKHAYSLVAIGLAAAFVAVFFTGRVDSKHLTAVAPRVGLDGARLDAMVPRVATASGTSHGTARRVVYLLACSGRPTAETMEALALQAAGIARQRRLGPREAALVTLGDSPLEAHHKNISDC